MQLILASASPARLRTLRAAGLSPEVIVSGVDEERVTAATVSELVGELARRKAETVAQKLPIDPGTDRLIIGCDSLLDLDGEAVGKPRDADAARARWQAMRGRRGVLHTGHALIHDAGPVQRSAADTASTEVWFADLSDGEIDAYISTGEPLQVAGAFTIDGLGGPFVTRIAGDHHNVVGISLPLLRRMVLDLGLEWPSLWTT